MITLALDENGQFEPDEKKERKKTPVFIAGLLYDDCGDAYDARNERYRIMNYLQSVCNNCDEEFPEALHANESSNLASVRAVKTEIGNSLKEFIQKGTYQGQDLPTADGYYKSRVGKYVMFVELKSASGIRSRINYTLDSNLVKETIGSNLYIHMIENAVTRLLFHNPMYSEISDVSLNFPTRKVFRTEIDDEYRTLGYRLEKAQGERGDNGEKYYDIVSADIYRTMMESEATRCNVRKFNIRYMDTKPISYKKKGTERGQSQHSFLYLADIICSMLSYGRIGEYPSAWMNQMVEWGKDVFGEDRVIAFGYDDIDEEYKRALNAVENGDYYTALEISYDAGHGNSEFAQHYHSDWFPVIEKKVTESDDAVLIGGAVQKLNLAMYKSNLNQQKLYYIFEKIKMAVESGRIKDISTKEKLLYELYNAGTAVFNHLGYSEQANCYFDMAMEHLEKTDLVQILRMRNRKIVSLDDSFEFDEARNLAKENVAYQKKLAEIRSSIFPGKELKDSEYGKSLSQYGQALSVLKDTEAETNFKAALKQMKEGSSDYQITLSYLLHYYLDNGMFDEYRNTAPQYFGGENNVDRQLEYLLKLGTDGDSATTFKFGLYVFARALWCAERDALTENCKSFVLHPEMELRRYDKLEQRGGHPWEMIYKYFALIAYHLGDKRKADEYMRCSALDGEKKGSIIDCVIHNGRYEFAEYVGDTTMMDEEKAYFENLGIDRKKIAVFMYH
ncbi:hypothetical protein [[Clostridium] aminophilum]|uniref:Uncharacterized protein n=1 Tax=[Clostridium] aminophilum TaxID=1526 RepID=A0A1I6JQP2_9FIRM|nr:hypothetical protein [[Clostridium] aminophilum]SFR81248.1 hypothetical protein SAMN02910262_01797 [[Clostridium] aminophilum]